jgi:hypothetical protein
LIHLFHYNLDEYIHMFQHLLPYGRTNLTASAAL